MRTSWNKGLTKETDKRVKKYGEGSSQTLKILYQQGKIKIWNKGLTKENDERIKQYAEKLKGRRFSKEHRKKLSEIRKAKFKSGKLKPPYPKGSKRPEISGENHPLYGKHHSLETRRKISKAHMGLKLSEKTKRKIGIKSKALWKDPNYRSLVLSKWLRTQKPNKIEMRIIHIINQNKLPYKYVGNGELIIKGKCPDFVHKGNKKKIIEVFGDYWHGKRARNYSETEKGRKEFFSIFGFDTLILWESTINRLSNDAIAKKIKLFEVK